MKIDKNDFVTLSDNIKYLVVSKVKYQDSFYLYLADIVDNSNIKIITIPYYIDKNIVVNAKENILIDDYGKNIDKWINSGGIGIQLKKEKRIDRLLVNYINN